MRKYLLMILVVISNFSNYTFSQMQDLKYNDPKEKEIFECWRNDTTLKYDIIECLLIAEEHSDQIQKKNTWLNSLEKEISSKIDSTDSPMKKGKQLFRILHDRVFRKYSTEATAASLISNGEFNCVTATALFYHFGSAIGIPMVFHATPFHVSPVIMYKGEKIWVELTDPSDGFDTNYDRSQLVDLLVENKFITKEELHQKGEETVYEDFIKGHYRTSPMSIVGYHYYNYALKLLGQQKAEETFWAIAKANMLEKEDEVINKVYDVVFLSLCSQPDLTSSYLPAVATYFNSRISDTTNSSQTIAGVFQAVSTLIENKHEYLLADSIMLIFKQIPIQALIENQKYAELCQYVSVNKAIDLSRKGRYEDSYSMISGELRKDPENAKVQDLYTDLGLFYIQKLLSTGKSDIALSVIDSMNCRFPGNVRVKDEYIRVIIVSTMESGKYRNNPLTAYRSLTKGYQMDSTNYYVSQALAEVCHELAMAEIRKTNYRSARSYIIEGLKYIPDHEYLKSDLELLQQSLSKLRK